VRAVPAGTARRQPPGAGRGARARPAAPKPSGPAARLAPAHRAPPHPHPPPPRPPPPPPQPLEVHAFKEARRDAHAHKKPEPTPDPAHTSPAPEPAAPPAPTAKAHPVPAAKAPPPSPLRARSLFDELQAEVDALSRAFLGEDWHLTSPFAASAPMRRGAAPAGAPPHSPFDLLAEPHLPGALRLAADVHEEEGAYVIKLDVPGMCAVGGGFGWYV
jgi:hypothetical protein